MSSSFSWSLQLFDSETFEPFEPPAPPELPSHIFYFLLKVVSSSSPVWNVVFCLVSPARTMRRCFSSGWRWYRLTSSYGLDSELRVGEQEVQDWRLRRWDVLLHRQKLRRNPAEDSEAEVGAPFQTSAPKGEFLLFLTQVKAAAGVRGRIICSWKTLLAQRFCPSGLHSNRNTPA